MRPHLTLLYEYKKIKNKQWPAGRCAFRMVRRPNGNILLASDGLWDFVSNEETASLALSTGDAWDGAARCSRLARARWLTRTAGGADDTTVVIVRFADAT
jgi:serine/threonine protein phosphatase PrpC